MRPLLHPSLLNGRTGDPALYIETLFEKRAILFDLGDITALTPRNIQRLDHVFVSHAHIDHLFGFDRLLRVLVGRDKKIRLYGPTRFIDDVHHKLQSYRWNLVDRYRCDLIFEVREIDASFACRAARFSLKKGFAAEALGNGPLDGGTLYSDPTFRVSTAVLEHGTPCLAFAMQETAHINIWKNRLAEMDLPVGPWLRELKRAVTEDRADDYQIRIHGGRDMPLGRLRDLLTVTPGQKIAYVTDVADTAANRSSIIKLAQGADILFIEAPFAEADANLAAARAHLTTAAAGQIARDAGVRRVEPFHFSPRYDGEEERLIEEVQAAFGATRKEL
jgi:ribonuclease Z